MAEQGAQDRRIPASERKIRKAREQGQVPRSRDLAHFATIAGGGVLLMLGAPWIIGAAQVLIDRGFRFEARDLQRPSSMLDLLSSVSTSLALVLLAVGLAVAVLALLSSIAGGGWNWSWKPLSPRLDKFNPLTGLGQLLSLQQLGATLKACLLALILGLLGLYYLGNRASHFTHSLAMPLNAGFDHGVTVIAAGMALLVIALGAFALVDVPLQRHLFLRRLKMSTQEVREEHKELEGSPEIKGKVKSRMRELARRRMLAAVARADLVVMNPSHYAVALRYDESTMKAPKVVAKGLDLLALRIRDVAQEAAVPVLEAPPLARALYAHAELDREIPARLFTAVAQVLAWVYQLRAARRERAVEPPQPSNLPVPEDMDPQQASHSAVRATPRAEDRAKRRVQSVPTLRDDLR